MKISLLTIIYFVLGIIALFVLLNLAPAFGQFGESFIYLATFIAAFAFFDKYALKKIDTESELAKGNIAYAIFLLAIAVLFHAVATIVG